MLLLITYVLIALVFSFLCSIAEAVLLSITSSHIAVLEKRGKPAAAILRKLKQNINQPLAAILTLNTIAHTLGAAGAGAQATMIFGNEYLGIISAVLTLLILVFSEIIPKTLGAHYWKTLAPATAYLLQGLIFILYPFVKLSEKITRGMTEGPTLSGFSRSEFAAMAELGEKEGRLAEQESAIIRNLLLLRKTRLDEVMTPRTVIFSLPETTTVGAFFHRHEQTRFSRIPIYRDDQENIIGFVLRSDLLLAQARGNTEKTLSTYCREIAALPETLTVAQAFEQFLLLRSQIMLVIEEYGGVEGIVTLEDLLETLIGLEIVDESDQTEDMQKLALQRWRRRMKNQSSPAG